MNFRLPNRDLARIWRLGHEVVGWGRYLHRRPLAWWRFKPGSGGIHFIMREQLEAYQRAVKVEEQHAARCFAQASGCGAGGKTP
jgi:hypothetical protein